MSEHPWRKQYPAEGKDFTKIEINIPREMRTWLDEMCGLLKLPPWRLICIALDNERELPQPFVYPLEAPGVVYVPHAYTTEALKIYELLQRFRSGLGKDVLMMFRRQVGIPNKSVFMLALRELLETRMCVESKDFPKPNYMQFPDNYTVIRANDKPMASKRRIESEKTKIEKLEAKLARQRKKLDLMEGNRDRIDLAKPKLTKEQLLEQDRKEIREKYAKK